MKIAFINKYDTRGGAAIAALRLARGLELRHHTENRFLVGNKNSSDPRVLATRDPGWQQALERGINLVTGWLGFQYYFFPVSTPRILAELRRFRPEVISLHNIHGGYFDTGLLEKLGSLAPVVWTLHDMWAITANAAHSFGDENFKRMEPGKKENRSFPRTGINRGAALISRKKKIYSRSNLCLVTPSRWLYDLARQSPVLEGKRIELIPNGLDLATFSPGNRRGARLGLGIESDSIVLCFSSEKLMSSPYKGGKEMLEILRHLDRESELPVHILMIGGDRLPLDFGRLTITQTGYLKGEQEMIRCYQASDIFIYPTRADNLPSSLMEATACGLPSISFDVGGCREIIADGENGILVAPSDIMGFVQATLRLAADPQLREKFSVQARQTAVSKFDIGQMADAYYGLFQELIKT